MGWILFSWRKHNIEAEVQATRSGSLIRPDHPMLNQIQECSIPVEKVPWQCAILTHDAEYILAAPPSKEEHSIYVWAKGTTPLASVLQGQNCFLLPVCLLQSARLFRGSVLI